MRRLAIALALVLTVALGAIYGRPVAQGQTDTTILGQVISQALSTPNSIVTIGAVDGALSSDASIRDITIADMTGVWLRVDKVRLIWRRTALLQRRLEVERLEIGKLEILRRADPGPPGQATKPEGQQPLLPELPLKVEVQKFALGELVLGETLLGAAATVSAEGNAKLGPPAEGLNLVFNAIRKDRLGRFETRLSLVPATQALDIKLHFDEPEGGLVARLASLPGLPPVTLKLDGGGRLDAFNANLTFVAGPTIGAEGKATLARQGAGRRLGLDMDARIEGLLPSAIAPIFGGATRLGGGVFFADSGALDVQDIAVQSKIARLDVAGKIDPAKVADLSIRARALPTEGGITAAGAVRIGTLVFDGTVKGPVSTPRVDARFTLGDAELPAGKVKFAQVAAAVAPVGGDGALKVAVDADANGLAATDPAINRALGERARFTLDAVIDKAGVADVSALRIHGQAVDASFAGKAGAKALDGTLTVSAPDLSRFAAMSGVALKGTLAGKATLRGAPDEGRIEAGPDLKVSRFATGIAALDGVLGGVATLDGALMTLPGGGYGFRDLKVGGQHLKLRLDGQASDAAAAIDLAGDIDDLRKLDARLTGKAALAGRITGTAQRPDGTLRIELTQATALERPIPRLALDIAATNLVASPDGRVKLEGGIGGKPARGGFSIARQGADGWKIDALDLGVGSVALKGALQIAGKAATGTVDVAAADLDDISPLLLTRLSGQLDAKIVLRSEGGKQSASIAARGNRMRFGEASIDRLVADLKAFDLYNTPALAGTLAVDKAEVGHEMISRIRLDAKTPEAGGDITLAATARGFDLSGVGKLTQGSPSRLALSRFEARKSGRRIALAAPGAIEFGEGRVSLSRLAIALDGGRIDLDGQVAPTLDLVASARNVPLAALDLVSPGLGLSGTATADAKVSGSPAAPHGAWRASVANLTLPQMRGQGVPPLQISANGALGAGRTSLESTINAGKVGTFRTTGSVPIDGKGALDLRVGGRADLGFLNAKLAATGQRVGGAAQVDVVIAGPTASPQVSGGATLAGVSFSDAEQGFRLTDMSGRIAASGKTLTLQTIAGQTRNGGRIVLGGEIGLHAEAGFPGRITVRAQEAELMSSPMATAVANLALDIAGPLARRPTVGGTVHFTRLDVTIPERMPGSSRPLEHVKHVNAPAAVKAQLARKKKGAARRSAPAFDAALNITLTAPNRVFVRGRGLDAEMAGDMRLTGTLARPMPVGGFMMRKGKLVVAGKRLDFTRGKLTFSGGLTPELDFLAQAKAGDVTVQTGISGVADAPKFTFTSEPDLPQEEVLSRLLFNKGTGSLGPAQALQIAVVAAQFAGGGGNDAFEKMRKQLGVDSLDVNMGSDGKVGVGASRAINDRISIGVRAGAKPNDTAVSADVDVTRNIRVQGEVTAGGATSVGVGFEKEY